jgi:hypothetical protein
VSSKVPSVCCWTSQVRQRMDLVPVREELHEQERRNGRAYLPLANYTLTT